MTRRVCAVVPLFVAGVLAAGLAACSPERPVAVSPSGVAGSDVERYEAERLVGATENILLQTFGPPVQLRREPPAEVWQYRSPACVVDFYLYQSSAAVGLSVVHLEARSPDSGRLPVDSCLREL